MCRRDAFLRLRSGQGCVLRGHLFQDLRVDRAGLLTILAVAVLILFNFNFPYEVLKAQKPPESTLVTTNSAIEVRGDFAFLGANTQFTIMDVSDKANPVMTGSLTLPYGIFDIELQNNIAYVSYWYGIWVIDISDPGSPTKIGEYTDTVTSYMRINGNYIYASGSHFFRILDISDPTNITLTGSFESNPHTLSGLIDIDWQANHVFVMGSNPDKTWVIDVSDPANPTEVARMNYMGGWDMEVVGDIYYLAATACNSTSCYLFLESYDISDFADPVVLNGCFCWMPEVSYVRDLLVEVGIAYVANSYNVQIVNVSDPNQFEYMASIPVGGVRGLDLQGNYIYLLTDDYQLQIVESPLEHLYLPVIYRQ